MPSIFTVNSTALRYRLYNPNMKRTYLLFLSIFCVFIAAFARTYTVDEIPNVHVADSSRYVSNPDGIMSAEAVRQADNLMRGIRRTTSSEAVMVIVDDIEGGDIDTFATDLFGKWGLGKSDLDNGLLILVAKDLRRAAIRTGYGLEGVMPDIICAKILREKMFPAFRQGDYDGGMLATASTISNILANPDIRDEILSDEADADFAGHREEVDLKSFFGGFYRVSGVLTILLIAFLLYSIRANRNKSNHARYMALNKLKPTYLALTFFGLGLPALASVPLLLVMASYRNKPRICPRCAAKMKKVDEVHDNDFLTPAQDTEERIGSVDYDVWLCPKCGETDIEPYVKANSGFHKCEHCGGLTSRLMRERILRQPTTSRQGEGVKEYVCANCGHVTGVPFYLPMIVVAPIIMGGGRRGGGGGFGGGSFGGGFGGGMTGGGGASGGW